LFWGGANQSISETGFTLGHVYGQGGIAYTLGDYGGMVLKSLRFTVAGVLLAVAGCGAAPLSNPAEGVATPEADLPLLSDLDVPAQPENVALTATAPQVGGLFSQLLGSVTAETPNDAVAEETPADDGGLFGLFRVGAGTSNPASAPAGGADQVPPGTIMAFGEIAPTCGMSRRDMGTQVAKASGYTVYDTFPNSIAPRPHYITGFSDGCARQFTAALVLLGDVGTHEVVRYSKTRVDLPYSQTDNAYEAIKSSFCRAGFGKPCGARLERLGKNTTFVTAYERFGAGPIWAEFLLHDGAVAASGLEGQ